MTRISAPWLDASDTQTVLGLLDDSGHQAYCVGGCVRNALLDAPVADIDISTDARPEKVQALAEAVGLRVSPTGIEHGTVTVICNDSPFEVTTFRRDVETDGRRAVVAFANDVVEDARRRDFTMNALYVRADGTLVDPLGGLPDLRARHVRFIEDPVQRIREDYLRSLRFFRFHAWYGDPLRGIDPEGLAAVADNLDGLATLSRERVGAELLKLLAAPDPTAAVAAMRASGVLTALLPGADDRYLGPLVYLETRVGCPPSELRRLAAFGAWEGFRTLRLSRAQAGALDQIRSALEEDADLPELAYRHGADLATDALLLRCASLGQEVTPEQMQQIARGAVARLPITARDLMPAYSGAALGQELRSREALWIRSGFTLSRSDLMGL